MFWRPTWCSSQDPQQGDNALLNLVRCERLSNIALCADRKRLDNSRLAALRRHHYNRNTLGRLDGGKLAKELNAIHRGHVDIRQDQVKHAFTDLGECFNPISGLDHFGLFQPCLTQGPLDDLAHHGGVIHNQNTLLVHSPSPFSQCQSAFLTSPLWKLAASLTARSFAAGPARSSSTGFS